jgi:hypothetical protein
MQIVLAQQDSSYLPLAVGNYWKLVQVYPYTTNEIIEWKVLHDTVFEKRGKYFLLQGEFLEYVRKADNGDIMTYFPGCDTEFVRYPFSYPFYLYRDGYRHQFPRYRINDCGANPEWGEATSGIDFIVMSSLCCDWFFSKGKGPFRFFNGSQSFILQEYILNQPQLKVESPNKISDKFLLFQNYPNPFNPQTKIRFSLKQAGYVNMTIYNILGEKVSVLVDGVKESGTYEVLWDSKNSNGKYLSSGMYFYNMIVNSKTDNECYSETKFMFLNK